jgi:hypothetical protein
MTSASCLKEWRRALIMVLRPGIIEIVLSALKTLNVRKPAKFPTSGKDRKEAKRGVIKSVTKKISLLSFP